MAKRTDVQIYHDKKKDIKKILDEHLSFKEYSEYCRTKYKLSQNRCSGVWQEMWDDIREKFRLEKDKLVTKHLDRYWTLYNEAVELGDINTARNILNDISKLQGLAEPDKLEINQDTIIKFQFGGDEDNIIEQ